MLNTGATVAGDWRFLANKISDNDKFCPGDEEEGTPPLSGIGWRSPVAPTTGWWATSFGTTPGRRGAVCRWRGRDGHRDPGTQPAVGQHGPRQRDPRQRARCLLGRLGRGQRLPGQRLRDERAGSSPCRPPQARGGRQGGRPRCRKVVAVAGPLGSPAPGDAVGGSDRTFADQLDGSGGSASGDVEAVVAGVGTGLPQSAQVEARPDGGVI